MGKVADNERIKLRATFHNNLGVGLLLGGFLIPYLAIASNLGAIVEATSDGVSRQEIFKGAGLLASLLLAWWAGKSSRKRADEIIAQISD